MDAEGGLEQVIHLFGDLHIQAWIGKGKYHLFPRSQQLLLAPSVSALGVEHLPAAGHQKTSHLRLACDVSMQHVRLAMYTRACDVLTANTACS